MKKISRILALVLAALLLLGGCGETPDTSEESNVTVQYLPEKVENADGLPVLKWLCLADTLKPVGYKQVWNEEAVHQLNQMLEDRDMPFRLQIILLTRPSRKGQGWLEMETVQKLLQEADLICGSLTSDQMQQHLIPITEYALGKAQPSLENAGPIPQFWDASTVDGEIYGIRAGRPSLPITMGWRVSNVVLESYGLTAEDFQGKYFWEMDDVFARIFAENANEPFIMLYHGYSETVPSGENQAAQITPGIIAPLDQGRFQAIGSFYALDYGLETPAVVNLLETDYARSYQEAVIRYADMGYTTDDSTKSLLFYQEIGVDEICVDDGVTYIPVEPVYAIVQRGGYVSGISTASKYKDEALSLLALIGDDEAFRMQLFYGREGQDYTVSDDGIYTMIFREGEESGIQICYNMDFLSALSYYSGMTSEPAEGFTYLYAPSTRHQAEPVPEGKTRLQAHQDLMKKAYSYYPYAATGANAATLTFDFTSIMEETEAIKAVFEPYGKDYANAKDVEDDPHTEEDETRFRMTPEYYDKMLADMNAAGGDKIQAELQRQLDEWLKANPDWQTP